MSKPGSAGAGFVASLLLMLAVLAAVAGIVAREAREVTRDPDLIVAAAGPLATDPLFQGRITGAIATPVVDAVRDNLPLTVPGIDRLVASAVGEVISSDRFADLWEQTLRAGHTGLTRTLTVPDDALFVIDDGGVVQLRLRPIVAAGRQWLVDSGVPLAGHIPDVDGEVPITQSDLAARLPGYLALLDQLATLLPWVSAGLFALALLPPGRRLGRLSLAGLGVAACAGLVLLGLSGAGARLVVLTSSWATASTIHGGLDVVLASLRSALWWTVAVGIAVWIVVGLISRSRRPSD